MAFAAAGVAAGVAGARSAVLGLAALAVWSLWLRLSSRSLLWRMGMLVSGFGLWILAAPFAPAQALGLALRGFSVSAAVVVVGMAVPWTAPLALLQSLRAPPSLVAFLAILARHAVTVRDEAQRVWQVLLLRGAFDRRANLPAATRILLVALVSSAFRRGERVADVLALRGFEGRVPALPPWRWNSAELPGYLLTAFTLSVATFEAVG
ncbi:MAG: CbiQ family ECF transporter T component [Myxococcales bacterium]|jgi:energy-coupling factor transporter transmembrane protein EcfT